MVPAFNEAGTILSVLDDLYPRVDRVIVVDDGSADGTGALLDGWQPGHDRAGIVHFAQNQGLSAALRAGWDEVARVLAAGTIDARDVAFSIDADGQHEPAALHAMVDYLVEHDYDAVIGARDLSYHSAYKKFGNAVMTWIGRACGGVRFEDIESGYRVFRVGPLLEAQQYYRGYRYSETVEVAVLLARLGYRVDNRFPIHVPVARTRTRLHDAAVDALAMPLAWFRMACWRDLPLSARGATWPLVAAVTVAFLIATLAVMVRRSFFLAADSAQSYSHVWYLSESLFKQHAWPWHVALLENGQAVMFPYGLVPWLPDALLFPWLGDEVVTISMVVGTLLLIASTWYVRPRARHPLVLAVFLVNPLFWNGLWQFQLPAYWAFALAMFAAGSLERGHRVRAPLLAALAVASHPEMGIAALGLYTLLVRWRERRWFLPALAMDLLAVLLASPAIYLFVATPILSNAPWDVILVSAADNIRRLTVIAIPLLLAEFMPEAWRHHRAMLGLVGFGVLGTVVAGVIEPPIGLWEDTQPHFTEYLQQHPVEPGASYRVLVSTHREDGIYEFMRAGATLSTEFFSESVHRNSFESLSAYTCMLATRHVSHIVINMDFMKHHDTNELDLLEQLRERSLASVEYHGADGTIAYHVTPPADAAKGSLRGCGV